jgi:hypothetical protein
VAAAAAAAAVLAAAVAAVLTAGVEVVDGDGIGGRSRRNDVLPIVGTANQ